MTRYALLLPLLAGLALSSCSKPQTPEPSGGLDAETAAALAVEEDPVDIGDVEQGLWFQIQVAPSSLGGGVSQDIMEDARGKVNLATVTVTGAAPETLTLVTSVVPTREFPKDPVTVRPTLTVEAEYGDGRGKVKTEIPLAPLVISKQMPTVPIEETVEIMSHLDGVPTTMLLVTVGQVVLHSRGTDPASLDPATATAPADHMSLVNSNPLRVNFE